MKNEKYIVVPAPGYYGDVARIMSTHRTAAAALKAATHGLIARHGYGRKGDRWLRVYEQSHPAVHV